MVCIFKQFCYIKFALLRGFADHYINIITYITLLSFSAFLYQIHHLYV